MLCNKLNALAESVCEYLSCDLCVISKLSCRHLAIILP